MIFKIRAVTHFDSFQYLVANIIILLKMHVFNDFSEGIENFLLNLDRLSGSPVAKLSRGGLNGATEWCQCYS